MPSSTKISSVQTTPSRVVLNSEASVGSAMLMIEASIVLSSTEPATNGSTTRGERPPPAASSLPRPLLSPGIAR